MFTFAMCIGEANAIVSVCSLFSVVRRIDQDDICQRFERERGRERERERKKERGKSQHLITL